jgi:thiol-disulfide isomerase/thioredoxin
VLLLGLAALPTPAQTGYGIGDTAPDIAAVNQQGEARTLYADYLETGRYTILDFCAMWCSPCQLATEDIVPLTTDLAREGIYVNYIQLLMEDAAFNPADPADATAWANALGNPYDVLTGPAAVGEYANYGAEIGGSPAVPLFAYLDSEGAIVQHHYGYAQDIVRRSLYTLDSAANGGPGALQRVDITVHYGSETLTANDAPTPLSNPNGDFVALAGSSTLSGPSMIIERENGEGVDDLRNEDFRFDFFSFDPGTFELDALDPDASISMVLSDFFWADTPDGPDPGRDFEHELVTEGVNIFVELIGMQRAFQIESSIGGFTATLSEEDGTVMLDAFTPRDHVLSIFDLENEYDFIGFSLSTVRFHATAQFEPGDANGDGRVDVADLDILLAHWGETVTPFDRPRGDLDGDGVVGDSDLALVQAHWGAGIPPGGSIPEPGSAVLLGLAGVLLVRRRRA